MESDKFKIKRPVWNKENLYRVSIERVGALFIAGKTIQGHKPKDFEMKRDYKFLQYRLNTISN